MKNNGRNFPFAQAHRAVLAASLALSGASAFAADYYVVTPVKGRTASASSIQVGLLQASLTGAKVGQAFSYDFKPSLQVTGDGAYTGVGVAWSVASGALPAGLSLNAATGVLSGTPTAAGTSDFQVAATYKTKVGQRAYQVVVANVQAIVSLQATTTANFGSVAVGASATRTFTLANTGDGVATGVYAEAAGAGVALGTNTCGTSASPVAVGVGGSCQVAVTYTPTATGTLSNASLSVKGGFGDPLTTVLTGTATPPVDPAWAGVSMLLRMDALSPVDATGRGAVISGALTMTSTAVTGGQAYQWPASGTAEVTSGAASCDFGVADFTVDGWVRRTLDAHQQLITSQQTSSSGINSAAGGFYLMWNNTLKKLRYVSGGVAMDTVTLPVNTWTHIALVRRSLTTTLYVNGVSVGSKADNNNFSESYCRVGSYPGGTEIWRGQMDEFRVTKGVARYTANFTPSTDPLPAN